MSVKEELIKKVIIIRDFKSAGKKHRTLQKDDDTKNKGFKKLKRKYRRLLAFVFFFSIILMFMILPIVIAILTQDFWG